MKTILTIFLLIITTSAFAIGNYTTNDELYVLAPSGLKLRSTPDGETVLSTVPFGAKLKVLELKKALPAKTVDGLVGGWAKVSYEGKTGYIFDGYLSFLPAPKEACISLRQYCNDNFTKDGAQMTTAFNDSDSDDSGQTWMQLYKFKTHKIIYSELTGYEWGDENLTISGISNEEAYLIAKYIHRKQFAEAATYYKTNKVADVNAEVYSVYLPRKPGYFFAPLNIDGCTENLSISHRDKEDIVCIRTSSYC